MINRNFTLITPVKNEEKKLKISFICNKFPEISQTFVKDHIDYFIKKEHHVDIFTGSHLSNNAALINYTKYNCCFGLKSNLQKLCFFPLYFIKYFLKKPLLIIKTLNFLRYGKQAYYLKIFYTTIFLLERNINYDILMCHFGDSGVIGAFIKKELLPQAKLFCMFHGSDIREGIKKGGQIYKQLDIQSDVILSISKYNRKFLENWIKDKKKIINHPLGVDTKKFKASRNKIRKNYYNILTVGRLVREKGYSYALKATNKLIKNHPNKNITYHIIGDGYLKKDINRYIKNHRLEGKIILHGAKTGKELIKYYQQSDIFLLSSIAEAVPVVLMEAQSFEMPVVATKVGGVEEVVINEKSGFIVKPKDDNEIFKKLHWLIRNRCEWKTMGREGRKLIKEKYNSEILNQKLEQLFYKEVNKKQKGARLI
jgi:colanic acid/amylovoran biosynthesis glycosyltransferase